MPFKYLLSLLAVIMLSSCVTMNKFNTLKGMRDEQANRINEQENRINELEMMLIDTDRDGVPDYLDKEPNTPSGSTVDAKGKNIDRNGNGISDELEEYIANESKKLEASAGPDESELFFTQLAPTVYLEIGSFFNEDETLKQCNDKLVKVINTKFKIPAGQYKYFALRDGGYAIVTRIRCINPNNGAHKSDCAPANSCGFFAFNCVEEGFSQFLLFFISKKSAEGSNNVFSMSEFESALNNGNLSTNYNNLPELEKLISTKNKFDKFYTFNIRMFEIRRAVMSKPEILKSSTYAFESQMMNYFKN